MLWDLGCYKKVLNKINLAESIITNCISDSYAGSNHLIDDNLKLKAELKAKRDQGINYYPEILINK